MFVSDRVSIIDRKKTEEGYLLVSAKIARTGVQVYHNMKDEDGRMRETVRVYRPPEEVFAKDSMDSFALRPVTNDHPPVMVDAKNTKKYSVGTSGEIVSRDGNHLKTTLLITHADAIAAVENGKEEISNGYTADLEWSSGETPEGEAYDAIQRNIRGNHVAIVDAGRCGGSCRITDSQASCSCGGNEVTDNLKTITIDGLPVQVTDAAETVIKKLQGDVEKAQREAATSKTALDTAKDEHKKQLDAKQGEVDALTAKLTDEAIEARVADRAAVVTKAKSILGDSFDAKGKSNADIRKATVTKVLGEDKVKDKDESYITAAFDVIDAAPATGPTDKFRKVLMTADGKPSDPYKQYCDGLVSAHRNTAAAKED